MVPLTAALLACAGPGEPLPSLDGVWRLDASSGGVPPVQMTLTQMGTAVSGTGTAMGVDVPIPIAIGGTWIRANPTGPAVVLLRLTFQNGGNVTADFTGSLTSGGLLGGSVVYYGITSVPVSGTLAYSRVPFDTLPHDSAATGLEGTVTRGPITPDCQVTVPCYAPFSAGFTVSQGQAVVGRFQSDSAGRYEILLPPGDYVVAPDSGAPVFPGGQSRAATAGPAGITQLDLQFDTGIR